jgi:hypothetical protein
MILCLLKMVNWPKHVKAINIYKLNHTGWYYQLLYNLIRKLRLMWCQIRWRYNITGHKAFIHHLPEKHAGICKHGTKLRGLARELCLWNIHSTSVTAISLFPNEYQSITDLEKKKDIPPSPVTNANKIERPYYIYRKRQKHINLYHINVKIEWERQIRRTCYENGLVRQFRALSLSKTLVMLTSLGGLLKLHSMFCILL